MHACRSTLEDPTTTPALGAYAATAVIARAPYFAASAVAGVFYAPLAARRSAHEAHDATHSVLQVALPGALLVASLPKQLLDLVIPHASSIGPDLLAALALAGFGAAAFALGCALTAASGRQRLALGFAAGGVVLGTVLLILTARSSLVLAASSLGATTIVIGTLGLLSNPRWRRAILAGVRSTLGTAAIAAIPLVLEPLIGRVTIIWAVAAAATAALIVAGLVRRPE